MNHSKLIGKHLPLTRIFAIPAALAVVSAVGLVTALVGDGAWDAVSWACLGIPIVVTAWCLSGRNRIPR